MSFEEPDVDEFIEDEDSEHFHDDFDRLNETDEEES